MLQNQHVASKTTTTDQTVCVYAYTPLSSIKQAKNEYATCDVTVLLNGQGKIVNIFFLKQDTFST